MVVIILIKIEAKQVLTSVSAPKKSRLVDSITCLIFTCSVFLQSHCLVIVATAPCLMMGVLIAALVDRQLVLSLGLGLVFASLAGVTQISLFLCQNFGRPPIIIGENARRMVMLNFVNLNLRRRTILIAIVCSLIEVFLGSSLLFLSESLLIAIILLQFLLLHSHFFSSFLLHLLLEDLFLEGLLGKSLVHLLS